MATKFCYAILLAAVTVSAVPVNVIRGVEDMSVGPHGSSSSSSPRGKSSSSIFPTLPSIPSMSSLTSGSGGGIGSSSNSFSSLLPSMPSLGTSAAGSATAGAVDLTSSSKFPAAPARGNAPPPSKVASEPVRAGGMLEQSITTAGTNIGEAIGKTVGMSIGRSIGTSIGGSLGSKLSSMLPGGGGTKFVLIDGEPMAQEERSVERGLKSGT
ncbi:hypothetical protein FKW77_000420 [Venturia effusa]|uniref:Uncharacterized protein n=1 Tax=Venturia effusa TaxID=50376 RepID=A0A517LKZ1_9PEZI|nr:hypothetical protein FKW77_000420 [Venturia effusa]